MNEKLSFSKVFILARFQQVQLHLSLKLINIRVFQSHNLHAAESVFFNFVRLRCDDSLFAAGDFGVSDIKSALSSI